MPGYRHVLDEMKSEEETLFPMIVLTDGRRTPVWVDSPKDLPIGVKFTILLTNTTKEEFSVAINVCQSLMPLE